MAEHPTRRVPRMSPESSAYIPDPASSMGANLKREVSPQIPNSRWKTLLVEMLNETNKAKRELAAMALEEAIYERHRELTEQRSFNSESMAERMKMKEAFMRLLDVRSQISFPDRSPLPLEFHHVPRRAPDWGRSEAEAADWRRLLLQMLGENDHLRLERITAALDEAIFTRYQQLATSETLEASEERSELQLACDRLTLVRVNVLGQRHDRKAG